MGSSACESSCEIAATPLMVPLLAPCKTSPDAAATFGSESPRMEAVARVISLVSSSALAVASAVAAAAMLALATTSADLDPTVSATPA